MISASRYCPALPDGRAHAQWPQFDSDSDTGGGTSDVTAGDGPGTAAESGGTSDAGGSGGDQDLLDPKGCACTADDGATPA